VAGWDQQWGRQRSRHQCGHASEAQRHPYEQVSASVVICGSRERPSAQRRALEATVWSSSRCASRGMDGVTWDGCAVSRRTSGDGVSQHRQLSRQCGCITLNLPNVRLELGRLHLLELGRNAGDLMDVRSTLQHGEHLLQVGGESEQGTGMGGKR